MTASALRLEVERQAADLDWLARVERDAPLATSILWTADAPCDQRRSVVAAMRSPVALVLGGERSGKSKGQKDLVLASALGSDEPCVRHWLAQNRLPLDVIPPHPDQVYVVASRSGDSVRYHRPDFAQMVGGLPHRWTNRAHKGEASLEIQTTHHGVARIWFLSLEQGEGAYQGIGLRRVWIDEEPLGIRGRTIYRHSLARVLDQAGHVSISMVPHDGYTWVYDDLQRDRRDGCVTVELDAMDNPHLPHDRLVSHYAGMDEQELAVRRFGRFTARSGSVYPTWDPGDYTREGAGHVCHPFEIPADWPRYRAADFGLVQATAVVWAAVGDDDTVYLYREWYREGSESYAVVAEQVRYSEIEHDPEERYVGSWGDPAAAEGRAAFEAEGMKIDKANNDLAKGYEVMRERLRIRGDGRPRLKVFSTCPWVIRQVGGLQWDTAPAKYGKVQKKIDDHSADATRYLVVGIDEHQATAQRTTSLQRGIGEVLRRRSGRRR